MTRYLLYVYAALMTFLVIDKMFDVRNLERERSAHQWRQFSCKTLLDDPVTRRIMCVTPARRMK